MECGTSFGNTCSQCGASLPEGAKFCSECGAPTGVAAAPARPERPAAEPRAYTPKHLADKILRSKGAVEGERKQVTVLFADISESMDLAGRVDPEAWHGILDGFFQVLSAGVHRFEGTVNQYTGDGIMALFGAPIAHEDHAQRSCYAALHIGDELAKYSEEIKRKHGLNFSVRIGLNSGEVVVGKIGDDLRMDYTAQGQTVGLASRVEQLAAPNTAYMTASTAALVDGYFELRSLGEFSLKGVEAPVEVFQLEGVGTAKTRLDVSRARGFSRFVGRTAELEVLESALADARGGNRRVVGIVAEAGAGKSRLCDEFLGRVRSREITVLEAHCVAHGQMIPFLPVLELLRGFLGVGEQDDDRTARETIAGRLLLQDESFKAMLPVLFDFLGIADPSAPPLEMEAEARKKTVFEGLERMLACADPGTPAVTLFEDLHWIDGASDSFLAGMIALTEGLSELIVVNTRPGYRAEWMDEPFYTQIDLRPLDDRAVAEILEELLGHDTSVRGLADRIRKQTAGNPFFVEEVVRALVERETLVGVRGAYRLAKPFEEVVLPGSVHDVLAARIDRLDDREKETLETAAVIGKQFGETLIARVSNLEAEELTASLDTLVDGGFIGRGEVYPEIEYVFYHPLTQEVAYRTQLGDRRRDIHRRVAEAVEAACCGKVDENAALLAHHWENAGEIIQAVTWSKRAAEWAGSRDIEEARRHWLKIRDLLSTCPDCETSLAVAISAREALIEIGWKLGQPLEDAKALEEEGRELAARAGDLTADARLQAAYAMAQLFSGEVEGGLATLEEAAQVAGRSDDGELNNLLCGRLAYMYLLAGRLDCSLKLMDELAAGPPGAGSADRAQPLQSELRRGYRALPLTYMGQCEEADRSLKETIARVGAANDDPATFGTLNGFAVTLAWFTGDAGAALHHARAQVEVAETLGTPGMLSGAYDSMSVACLMNESFREAADFGERALSIARDAGTLLQSEAVFVANVAAVRLGVGDVEEAVRMAEEAVEVARKRRTPLFECRSLLVLARALLATDEVPVERTAAAIARALAIVEATGARGYEPFLHVEAARLARVKGESATGDDEIAQATQQFRAMGAGAQVDLLERSGDGVTH
jgi:class 3 adenylate cyclase/tetratricopeptide (TPR) repeat protein